MKLITRFVTIDDSFNRCRVEQFGRERYTDLFREYYLQDVTVYDSVARADSNRILIRIAIHNARRCHCDAINLSQLLHLGALVETGVDLAQPIGVVSDYSEEVCRLVSSWVGDTCEENGRRCVRRDLHLCLNPDYVVFNCDAS